MKDINYKKNLNKINKNIYMLFNLKHKNMMKLFKILFKKKKLKIIKIQKNKNHSN